MRRAPFFAALALAMALVAGPAVADHVNEPTTPITAVRMALYQYSNSAETLLTVCNGSEVVLFDNMRVETFVTAAGVKGNGNPSEHFDERLTLVRVLNLGQNNEAEKYEWEAFWRHSNIPPHALRAAGSGWESSQNKQQLENYAAGTVLRFIDKVSPLESGGSFTASCTFTVG